MKRDIQVSYSGKAAWLHIDNKTPRPIFIVLKRIDIYYCVLPDHRYLVFASPDLGTEIAADLRCNRSPHGHCIRSFLCSGASAYPDQPCYLMVAGLDVNLILYYSSLVAGYPGRFFGTGACGMD